MTPAKLKSIFVEYRKVLDRDYPGIEAMQFPVEFTTAPSTQMSWVNISAHYKFMCDEAQQFIDTGRIEKAMRWLGFLQGAFWRCGRFTLDELKNHSRPDSPEG